MAIVKKVRLEDLGFTTYVESLETDFFPSKRLKGILVREVRNFTENLGKITRAIRNEGAKIIVVRPSSPTGEKTDIL